MSSITLSSSVSQNLTSLQATQKLMDETSYKLTTGKKVNSALDDPIAYFAATDHTQKASDLQVLKDAMSEGIQTINAADDAITAITELVDSAKSLAKSALSADTTTERATYMSQYNDLLDQIDDLTEDAGYKGVNLLGGDELDVVFNESGDSKITVTGFAADATTGLSLATQSLTSGDWATADINTAISALDTAKSTLRAGSKTLSSQLSTITTRQDFTTNMINTLTEGASNLTNADTTAEGVNLTTLETQQSLAVQALSIANSASQAVLNLFQ